LIAVMQIHRATAEDCHAIAEVHVASWRAAYAQVLPADFLESLTVEDREPMWQRTIAGGVTRLLCAKDAGQVIGFAAFGKSRDKAAPADRAELYAVYVHPAWWLQGVGRELWRTALERIQAEHYISTSLWVMVGNDRAIRFYSAAGFSSEAGSTRRFELGGATLREFRCVCEHGG
jgi:ribosomal protein S18 acetylase RimI-like enzyme